MPRHPHLKLLPLLIALVLAGCGGGGGDGNGAGTNGSGSSTGTGNGGGSGGQPAGSGGSTNTDNTGKTTSSDPKLAAAATVLADGTAVGTQALSGTAPVTAAPGTPINGLACGLPSADRYGYAHLSVFQNGTQLSLPANIGVYSGSWMNPITNTQSSGCVYPLHTRDASGKIRIDPAAAAPTLGQFFAIWGQPLSASAVGNLSGTVTAYLNDGGTLTKYSGDPASIPLASNREITLVVGSAPAELPTYRWSDPPPLNTATPMPMDGTPIGASTWPDGNTGSGGQGQTVDGIPCTPTMDETYHVHAHLAIIRDGQALAIPANVGIVPDSPGRNGCFYSLHTHNASGEIHVESSAYSRFTLGQFFNIWGRPLSDSNVAGLTGQPIKIYLNDGGDVRQYVGNPADIELTSHRSVTIVVGSDVASIPTYSWDTQQ